MAKEPLNLNQLNTKRKRPSRLLKWLSIADHALKNNREKQTNIMLLTASISFVVLSFPNSVFDILRQLDFEKSVNFLMNRKIHRLVHLLVDIKHATNFILYCILAQKFREELKFIYLEHKTTKATRKNSIVNVNSVASRRNNPLQNNFI